MAWLNNAKINYDHSQKTFICCRFCENPVRDPPTSEIAISYTNGMIPPVVLVSYRVDIFCDQQHYTYIQSYYLWKPVSFLREI